MKIYRYKMALLALIALGFIACSKSRNRKSTFYINGIEYETRKFEYSETDRVGTGHELADMVYSGKQHESDIYVGFGFYLPYFPKAGQFPLRRYKQSGNAVLGIILDKEMYLVPSHNTSIVWATEEDGLGKYVIEPTWLRIQLPDPNDSSKAIEGNDSIHFSAIIY
ncbi:hypothetical protein [Edaphocola aurantiacus]|uniref:hypothetical protein n=1 Tax=Edaphocola aurantiacus TaxID=2601682 RepID=UPI001C9737BB|nr:hypothetical protein [Edaphocola aurantiacus]